jgi:hypothetical protein
MMFRDAQTTAVHRTKEVPIKSCEGSSAMATTRESLRHTLWKAFASVLIFGTAIGLGHAVGTIQQQESSDREFQFLTIYHITECGPTAMP